MTDKLEKGTYVIVTDTNHLWVSEVTGVSLENVQESYRQANESGNVCFLVAD